MIVRLIGGPKDGQSIEVEDSLQRLYFENVEDSLLSLDFTEAEHTVPHSLQVYRVSYQIEKLHGKNKTFYLGILEGTDIDEALSLLLH